MRRSLSVLNGVVLSFCVAAIAATSPASAFETVNGKRVMVVAGQQAVPVIDPAQRYDLSIRTIQQATYDALVKYEGDPAEVKPWLATSWTVNPDATLWTFKLDPRAKFQNGDPVDAAAVKASFLRTMKINKGPAWMYAGILAPERIIVVDPQTIRFALTRPFGGFLGFLPWWYIVNTKEAAAHEEAGDLGQKWLTDHTAGSGPYKVKRIEPNTVYELEAWDGYWKGWPQPQNARLGGIIYKIVTENSSRRAALVRGEVDVVTGLSAQDLEQLASTKGVVINQKPGSTPFSMIMNTQGKYMSDLNLRKAVAYAFDYDALPAIFNGKAKLMESPFPPIVQGYIKVDMPRKDLKKAQAYLAKSKWPKGGIEVEYLYIQGFEEERLVGLILIDSLKALNIAVKMVPMTWPNMVARAAKVETSPDFFAAFVNPISTDPDAVAFNYHPEAAGKYYGAHFLKDPALTKVIEKARAESQWKVRAPLYAQIQKDLIADQPAIYGMLRYRSTISRDYVKGFVDSPMRMQGEIDLYPMYIGR